MRKSLSTKNKNKLYSLPKKPRKESESVYLKIPESAHNELDEADEELTNKLMDYGGFTPKRGMNSSKDGEHASPDSKSITPGSSFPIDFFYNYGILSSTQEDLFKTVSAIEQKQDEKLRTIGKLWER